MERVALVVALTKLGAAWHESESAYVKSVRYPVRFANERLVTLVHALSPIVPDDCHILDAGASHGCVSDILSSRWPRASVLATSMLDQNVSALLAAKERLRWNSVNIRRIDSGDFSTFTSASFSHIFSHQALVVDLDPEQYLREAFRVLRPGGVIAISLEILNIWLVSWTQTVRETINPTYNPQSIFNDEACNSSRLIELLRSVGFEEVRSQTMVCPHSPEQNISAVINEVFKERLADFQGLTPGITNSQLARARPSLTAYLARKYSMNKRAPANIMVWAVGRRPAEDTSSDDANSNAILSPNSDKTQTEESEEE